MTVHEWLNRAKYLDKEINALKCDRTRYFAYKDFAKAHPAYIRYNKMIDKRIAELQDIRQSVTKVIHSISDSTLKQILYMRYIQAHTWEHIAESVWYSDKHVKEHLYKKALSEAEKIIQEYEINKKGGQLTNKSG